MQVDISFIRVLSSHLQVPKGAPLAKIIGYFDTNWASDPPDKRCITDYNTIVEDNFVKLEV